MFHFVSQSHVSPNDGYFHNHANSDHLIDKLTLTEGNTCVMIHWITCLKIADCFEMLHIRKAWIIVYLIPSLLLVHRAF